MADNLQAPELQTNTQGQPIDISLTLADGTGTNVQTDSAAQIGNAIDPYGQQDVKFKEGNFDFFKSTPQILQQKNDVVNRTIIPLIEKALIELLGSSNSYARKSFISAVSFNEKQPIYNIDITYFTELWIGQDVEYEYIIKDANYVLETIKVVPNVDWRKCEIDTAEGELRVAFTF